MFSPFMTYPMSVHMSDLMTITKQIINVSFQLSAYGGANC